MQNNAYPPIQASGSCSCITIGNFDGVHLGHQALIREGISRAKENNLEFDLLTFWPHPALALNKYDHFALTTAEERRQLLQNMGIDKLVEIPFTKEFASLSARDFISKWLLPLNPRHIVIGHDFAFGHNRQGGKEILKATGKDHGFTVTQAEPFCLAGQPVSSTRLRKAIKSGNVEEAAALLGRFYALTGTVESGFGRGAGLGFPTANLAPDALLLPANGVYAAYAHANKQKFFAVTNIGFNPTFAGTRQTIETFLMDADQNLYNQPLRLEFVARLRSERKFDSPADLTAQIAADTARARKILENASANLQN